MLLKPYERKTLFWLIMTQLMHEPLFVMYGFSAMILRKYFAVGEMTIGFFLSIKPIVSIFSFYWGAYLAQRPNTLRYNFLIAKILARLPFLVLPLFPSPIFLIFCCVNYILFYRASKPAWIEILHINTTHGKKRMAFGWAFTLTYLEGMLLAVVFGSVLDVYPNFWPYLFFGGASLGFVNIYFLQKLPIAFVPKTACKQKTDWKKWILQPWVATKRLMIERKDFAKFQLGFTFCGFGLMFIQPALPLLMVDVLNISYFSFGLAYTSWKSICIAFSSPIWSYAMRKFSIFTLCSWVFFFAALLPFFLLFSTQNILCLYVAYIFYGIAQGGSQLIWNLSGSVFAGKHDSAAYTTTNVLMIGVRGLFAPFLGAIFAKFYGPFITLSLGAAFCVFGSLYMIPGKKKVYAQ